MTRYQIARIVPTFDDRDSRVGSRAFVLPNLYETFGLPNKLAVRLGADDEGFSDDYHVVFTAGGSPYLDRIVSVTPVKIVDIENFF